MDRCDGMRLVTFSFSLAVTGTVLILQSGAVGASFVVVTSLANWHLIAINAVSAVGVVGSCSRSNAEERRWQIAWSLAALLFTITSILLSGPGVVENLGLGLGLALLLLGAWSVGRPVFGRRHLLLAAGGLGAFWVPVGGILVALVFNDAQGLLFFFTTRLAFVFAGPLLILAAILVIRNPRLKGFGAAAGP